jgi:hypothetical protein
MEVYAKDLKPGDIVGSIFNGGFIVQAVFPAPRNKGHLFIVMSSNRLNEIDRYTTFHTDFSREKDTYSVISP